MEQFPSMFKTTEDRKEGKIDTTKTCFRQETFCSKGKERTVPFANQKVVVALNLNNPIQNC